MDKIDEKSRKCMSYIVDTNLAKCSRNVNEYVAYDDVCVLFIN